MGTSRVHHFQQTEAACYYMAGQYRCHYDKAGGNRWFQAAAERQVDGDLAV